jgi:multiple sugar transport system permease protein
MKTARKKSRPLSVNRKSQTILRPIGMGVVLAIFLVPILAIMLTSFKTGEDVTAWPPKFFFVPTLDNYREIFQQYPFGHYLANSLFVTLATTLISLLIGLPAAYALAKLPIRKREDVAMWFLSLRVMPPFIVVIPFFVMLRSINLLDNPLGLTIVDVVSSVPFVVWVSRGFFREIPSETHDAALVDGCSPFAAFWHIGLPMARGGIAATAILSALFVWNEFLFALIIASTERAMTMPVAVTLFIRESGIGWGTIGAAAVLMVLPMFALTLMVQRYIVAGLSLGTVK